MMMPLCSCHPPPTSPTPARPMPFWEGRELTHQQVWPSTSQDNTRRIMKALYPSEHKIPLLSRPALALKIARHSKCCACSSCSGLRPASNVELFLDDSHVSSQGFQPLKYLDLCACGHGVRSHGADESLLGKEEYARRGRVAVRLDEVLQSPWKKTTIQDVGKLLDFEYMDKDVRSLRLQMSLDRAPSYDGTISPGSSTQKRSLSSPSSTLSELPEHPPAKRLRISPTLSELNDDNKDEDDDDDDDDDDEDEPLAARVPFNNIQRPFDGGRRTSNQRSGKGLKTKGLTAPASIAPPTGTIQAEMNGQIAPHGDQPRVKVEDRMDEGQLARLATGVTVDTCRTIATTSSNVKPEKKSQVELRRGIIQITPVENDGQPRSRIILTGLKTLFQKQLPKMPREYIARLVYDSNSKCLAIIKHGLQVVGAICYRPFPHRGFAEIVFFATNGVDQVKGYGGMLMDHFKNHIRSTYPKMMHFLTYADNYAVGYFKKQGFSKEITLPRSVWAGYIKDYEGGTIMQCTMLAKVNYLETRDILNRQREAVMAKIRQISRSHVVYPGLPQFQNSSNPNFQVDYRAVPGLSESGWTPDMSDISRSVHRSPERAMMERLLSDLQTHPVAWAFLQPVNGDEVADYYEVIKQPMDFSTMEQKLETNQYHNLEAFIADTQLVFDNCRLYNPEGSIYARNATKMEKFLKDQVAGLKIKQED